MQNQILPLRSWSDEEYRVARQGTTFGRSVALTSSASFSSSSSSAPVSAASLPEETVPPAAVRVDQAPSTPKPLRRPGRSPTIRFPHGATFGAGAPLPHPVHLGNLLSPSGMRGASGVDVCEGASTKATGGTGSRGAGPAQSSLSECSSAPVTPPAFSLVMESLVRRYRAEENRFEQWRHSGERAPPRSQRRGSRRRSDVEAFTVGTLNSAPDTAASSSVVRRALWKSVQLLHTGDISRSVRDWWRRRKGDALPTEGPLHHHFVPAPSVAPSPLPPSSDHETASRHGARQSAKPDAATSPSWAGYDGLRLLERLSRSLTLSSERGTLSRVKLQCTRHLRDTQQVAHHGHHRGSPEDSFGEESSSEGATEENPFDPKEGQAGNYLRGPEGARHAMDSLGHCAPSIAIQHSADRSDLAEVLTSDGQGTASRRRSPSTSSTLSRTSDDVETIENVCPTTSTDAPSVEHDDEDEGRFTLSWVRGLRRRTRVAAMPMASTDGARASAGDDESFRSASRLLERSRARFSRWMRRQRHHMAAKRDVRYRSLGHSAPYRGAPPENSCISPTSAVPSTTSELHRRTAQAPLSPWECPLPFIRRELAACAAEDEDGADDNGATQVHLRDYVRAMVAAGSAARTARGQGRETVQNWSVPVQRKGDAEVAADVHAPSRAARQRLEDAQAVAQLSGSLALLAKHHRRGVANLGGALAQQEEDDKEGDPGEAGGIRASAEMVPPPSTNDRDADPRAEGQTVGVSVVSPRKVSLETPSQTIMTSNFLQPRYTHSPSVLYSAMHPCCSSRPTWAADDDTNVSEKPAELDAFHSLLTSTTHTARDMAVRSAYEAIMSDVCTSLVKTDLERATTLCRGTVDRALTQWVQRQVIQELVRVNASLDEGGQSTSASVLPQRPPSCKGIIRHLRSGTPIILSWLSLDEEDKRALENVYDRRESDAVATTSTTAGYAITFRQLASLRPHSWLNDQVINNYLQLLCEASERDTTATATEPHETAAGDVNAFPQDERRRRHGIASMGTHFYAKVESEYPNGPVPLKPDSAILRWLRRRQHLLRPYEPTNPQSVRAVLVPVNLEAQHWALAVLYRVENSWVLYDSMSRSDRARQRGASILQNLSYAWDECRRHFGIAVPAVGSAAGEEGGAGMAPGAPGPSSCLVAVPYVPYSSSTATSLWGAGEISPIDSLQPYGSIDEVRRAAKRLRHQEEVLEEQVIHVKRAKAQGAVGNTHAIAAAPVEGFNRSLVALPRALTSSAAVGMWSDTEVEWFTSGFVHIPQQANGYDCGVFVCQVAWCIAEGVAVSFTQPDITKLRQVILLELLHQRLLRRRYPTAHTSASTDA